MLHSIKFILKTIKNNKIILENYFFMTITQFLNSLFYILIYPFIINRLGVENYGIYIFDLSIVTYFIVLISFGFDLPSLSTVSKNPNNNIIKSRVVSQVLSAKIYLFFLASLFFIFFILLSTSNHHQILIYIIIYCQAIMFVLVPTWYFQGIQKMKIITYIQVVFKILSLPFILIFINNQDDLILFTIIMTSSVIFSGVTIFVYLIYFEKLNILFLPLKYTKQTIKESIPFFWSTSTGIIKQQSTNVLIGFFFGMNEVAYYDLASKIILLPQSITMSINNVLFPRIVNSDNIDSVLVKKIIKYEIYFGLFIVGLIAIFGKYVVIFLGGEKMILSYHITLLLSFTIITWLIVGCYINFIFVPQKKYKIISNNQFVAFFVYIIISLGGLFIYKNIYIVVIATVISGISEVIYCKYLINKYKFI